MKISELIDNHPGFIPEHFNSILYVVDWQGSYYPYEEIPEMLYVVRLKHNYYSRLCRMVNHIQYAFLRSSHTYFLTLTFSDEFLYLAEDKNISHRIKKALSCFKYYIYNKDFGSTNNRVHYHCIVFSDEPVDDFNWPYGFKNQKEIFKGNFSSISHYVIKYSCHELKSTNRTYYSFKGYDSINETTIRNFFKNMDKEKILSSSN